MRLCYEKIQRLYQARKQKREILHQLYLTSLQKGIVCESEPGRENGAGSEGGLASSQWGEWGSIEGLASSQGSE